jgi:transposase
MNDQELISQLLENVKSFHLEQVDLSLQTIRVTLTSTQPNSTCPKCSTLSSSVHSHYTRTLTDLPWAKMAVSIVLNVRRFRCRNAQCPLNAFCERFKSNILPYKRKTSRFSQLIDWLGANIGANPSARLLNILAMPTSASTILRSVKSAPLPELPNPRVIGVDDFAFKRGQTYGTIIVDLERSRPIDILVDRKAQTLASWLKAHPSVEVISRDRSLEYAKGVEISGLNVEQTLDRWHLLKNLREMLERVLNTYSKQIKQVLKPQGLYRPAPRTQAERAGKIVHQQARTDFHAQVREFKSKGCSERKIAKLLKVSRGRVIRSARSQEPLSCVHPRKPSILDAFEPFLRQRWSEGCRNALQLLREIRELGFTGSRKRVALWAQVCRERERHEQNPFDETTLGTVQGQSSHRQLAWLLLSEESGLTADELKRLQCIEKGCPLVAVARRLALEFQGMVRKRSTTTLEAWFSSAAASQVSEVKSFAAGLEREGSALKNALESTWSNGQVEGWVNKLKLLKRQGFGRAGFELLRKRVLLAS